MTAVAAVAAVAAALAGAGAASGASFAALAPASQPVTVRGGDGYAVVSGPAAVLGRADNGLLILTEAGGRCSDVAVFGAEYRAVTSERRIFRGRDLRFRVVSERCRIEVAGRDLDVSAVVRGYASVKGSDGRMTVAGDPRAVPAEWATYRLGVDPPGGLRPTLRSLLRLEIRWMRATGMSWARIKQTAVWRRFAALG